MGCSWKGGLIELRRHQTGACQFANNPALGILWELECHEPVRRELELREARRQALQREIYHQAREQREALREARQRQQEVDRRDWGRERRRRAR